MFQCAEHQIECLDRLLSLACVHPFEKAVDEGVVLEGVFRAPLAHWMRIAPLATAVATAHKRVMVDHEGFNGRYSDCRVTNIIHQEQQRAGPMSLWMHWWNAIWRLRPAFSRLQTFLWFATAVAGFTVRTDMLGVTSIVRALNLDARCYNTLIDCFYSSAVKLDRLTALWTQVVLRLFPQPLRVNGRCVLVGDGIKVPKCGRKMPAVKLLHQQSDANTKPEYIMGHSLQAVSVLVGAAHSFFAVPLAARIHEGLVWSNRDRRTLLDKMLALLGLVGIATPFYLVADAYYAAGKVVNGLIAQGHHLVSRVKSNAVAYAPAEPPKGKRKRGRPRRYGQKIKLKSLLSDPQSMIELASPVYGERNVMLRYRVCDLIWRPAGRLVRFLAVIHPTRGACLLMATDLALTAADIIHLYGLRFKIEHSFKQAVRLIGAFAYHFWMMDMKIGRAS